MEYLFTISEPISYSGQIPDLKVSIVIPSFNNADFISETLGSVLSQTYLGYECIVVDDGSQDETVSLVSKFTEFNPNFKLLNRPADLPKGANSCRNFGASQATGDLLLFLDADDLLTGDCLKNRLSRYNGEDLLVGSTGCFSNNIENSTPFFANLNPKLSPKEYRSMFLEYQIPWHTSSCLWKKSFFDLLRGFDSSLLRFQDVEIHMRALNYKGLELKLELSGAFTSLYRQSDFHKKVTLAKRRFILDEGFKYLEIVKRTVAHDVFPETEGLLVYLFFRFEEVFEKSDLDRIRKYTDTYKGVDDGGFNSFEFKMMNFIFGNLITSPNRIRKYFSYGLYRSYSKRKRSRFLA